MAMLLYTFGECDSIMGIAQGETAKMVNSGKIPVVTIPTSPPTQRVLHTDLLEVLGLEIEREAKEELASSVLVASRQSRDPREIADRYMHADCRRVRGVYMQKLAARLRKKMTR